MAYSPFLANELAVVGKDLLQDLIPVLYTASPEVIILYTKINIFVGLKPQPGTKC